MSVRDVLASPIVYQSFQEAGGFFGARLKGIAEFLPLTGSEHIIDIGCGPGFILGHLPAGVDYVGFDTDESYIRYAKAKFGSRGQFHCRIFDDEAAHEHGPADVVMMNGVLHHLDDATAAATLATIARALKPDGRLFTLDGCYRPGQSSFKKYLLDNDRGQYVRDEAGYRALLGAGFGEVATHIREDISRVPYTFIVAVSTVPQALTQAARQVIAARGIAI